MTLPYIFPVVLSLLVPASAFAQTALDGPPPLPGSESPLPPVSSSPALPPPPVTQKQVDQTRAHFEGRYTTMTRRSLKGGAVQEVWDDANPQAGGWLFEYCPDH